MCGKEFTSVKTTCLIKLVYWITKKHKSTQKTYFRHFVFFQVLVKISRSLHIININVRLLSTICAKTVIDQNKISERIANSDTGM